MTGGGLWLMVGATALLLLLGVAAAWLLERRLRQLGYDGKARVPVRRVEHRFDPTRSATAAGQARTGLHEPATLTVDETWLEIGGSYPVWIARHEAKAIRRLRHGIDGRHTVLFVTDDGTFHGVVFSTNDPEFPAKLARFGWPELVAP